MHHLASPYYQDYFILLTQWYQGFPSLIHSLAAMSIIIDHERESMNHRWIFLNSTENTILQYRLNNWWKTMFHNAIIWVNAKSVTIRSIFTRRFLFEFWWKQRLQNYTSFLWYVYFFSTLCWQDKNLKANQNQFFQSPLGEFLSDSVRGSSIPVHVKIVHIFEKYLKTLRSPFYLCLRLFVLLSKNIYCFSCTLKHTLFDFC